MNLSIHSFRNQAQAQTLMKEIGVDPGGIQIMAPKTVVSAVKVNRLPIFAAHILKQEALSLGADTAVSRGALTGKTKYTDCLIIGNPNHYRRLCEKLKLQPYGLSTLAKELESALLKYNQDAFRFACGPYELDLSARIHLMGIVNVTPDSFSGDGFLRRTKDVRHKASTTKRWRTTSKVLWRSLSDARQSSVAGEGRGTGDVGEYAQKLVDEGADIIDIGGESSRPGARAVSVKEELQRVLPALKAIRKKAKVPISIDTSKAEVARQALDNGANIINDITSLRADARMAKVVKRYQAGLVLMHMKGSPRTMQRNPRYTCLMDEVTGYLNDALRGALNSGIDFEKIIVDPGIGFGKTAAHNLEIIKSLAQLKILGRPILVGLSRKSFIGKLINQPVTGRLYGTISGNCLAALNGARILRVHDVKAHAQALRILEGIVKC